MPKQSRQLPTIRPFHSYFYWKSCFCHHSKGSQQQGNIGSHPRVFLRPRENGRFVLLYFGSRNQILYLSSDNIGLYVFAALNFSVRKYRRPHPTQFYCLMIPERRPKNRVLALKNAFFDRGWAPMNKMTRSRNLVVDSRLCCSTRLVRGAVLTIVAACRSRICGYDLWV